MKCKLKEIAETRSGLFSDEKEKSESDNGVLYIYSSDITEEFRVQANLNTKIPISVMVEKKHLLKDGDILFVSKGRRNFALVYEPKDKTEKAVASPAFIVISPKKAEDYKAMNPDYLDIDPYFLAWLLNRHYDQVDKKPIKTTVNKQGKKSPLPFSSVPKSELDNVDVVVPKKELQIAIGEIWKYTIKEGLLADDLKKLKEKQMFNIMYSSLTKVKLEQDLQKLISDKEEELDKIQTILKLNKDILNLN